MSQILCQLDVISIQSIDLFFRYNFKLQMLKFKYSIDNITINFLSSKNIVSMKNIRRKLNLVIDLSKFTFNKNILL